MIVRLTWLLYMMCEDIFLVYFPEDASYYQSIMHNNIPLVGSTTKREDATPLSYDMAQHICSELHDCLGRISIITKRDQELIFCGSDDI